MDEREIANHVLARVDQAAYQNAASRILGVHLEIGGRRVFDAERLRPPLAAIPDDPTLGGTPDHVTIVPLAQG